MKPSYQNKIISSLSLPTRLDYLEPLQNYTRGLCHVHGCEDKETAMVLLAVEEAVSNVIQHGYSSKEEIFDISFEIGQTGLTIEIHEKGLPFEPDKMGSHGIEKNEEDNDSEHGIGLRLMKGAMDRVEFLNLGKKGKLLRMLKYFPHERVDQLFSKEELQRNPSSAESQIKEPCCVRPLIKDESIEVSRCAYRAYGYTYREFIYYPEKIWELNEDGHLRSFVLVDAGGTLLGHVALSFSSPDAVIAEMAAAFVNPSCRGRGFLGQLVKTVMGKAGEMELEGLFVHAVTSHKASQKGAARAGLFPTGLLLASLFPDLEFKDLTGKVVQKENALLMFKQLKNRPLFKVWVPGRYSQMIGGLANNLQRNISVQDEQIPLPLTSNGEGNRYYRVEEFNFSEIRISSFSEDVLEEMKQRVGGFIKDHVDVIYLYIDMECPEAGTFASRCRDMGFFFCGYMPGEMNGRDALILQKLNDIRVDFTALSLVNEKAEAIVKFIEKDMSEEE